MHAITPAQACHLHAHVNMMGHSRGRDCLAFLNWTHPERSREPFVRPGKSIPMPCLPVFLPISLWYVCSWPVVVELTFAWAQGLVVWCETLLVGADRRYWTRLSGIDEDLLNVLATAIKSKGFSCSTAYSWKDVSISRRTSSPVKLSWASYFAISVVIYSPTTFLSSASHFHPCHSYQTPLQWMSSSQHNYSSPGKHLEKVGLLGNANGYCGY